MNTSETTATGLGLRDVARVHEIDRRLQQIRLVRAGVTLVLFPGFALVAFVIVRRILQIGLQPTATQLWGGAVTAITAAAAVIQGVRATRDTAARLEAERSAILAGTADGPFRLARG